MNTKGDLTLKKATNYATTKTNYSSKLKEENRNEMKVENTQERFNLLDAINRISNRIALSETQEMENRKAIEKASAMLTEFK